MTLENFLEKHGSKMRHLETLFLCDVFYADLGEKGLDLIEPEVDILREDGTDRHWRIDFVITTKMRKYAVECNGYNYHAEEAVSRERFDELQEKSNEIRRQGFHLIELSRDQITVNTTEAIYQLRRDFIADEELYSIFLNRNKDSSSPNPVQKIALTKLKETRSGGHNKGLVVLATGLGKTYLGIFDTIQTEATKVLYIVHVGEVLKKSRNSFEKVVPARISEMGNFSGSTKDKDKNILFATIQTLTRDENLQRFAADEFDYIILDETHHLAAPSYKKVFEYFKPKFFLGLTATPERMDKEDILPFYDDNLVFEMGQSEAIKKGYLTGLLYKGFKDNVDYSNIFYNGLKYDVADLNKLLMIEKRDKAIISKYKELANDKKTIGFCVSIEHAEWCAKKFKAAGIKAEAIHSKLDKGDSQYDAKKRDKLVSDFEKNVFKVAFVVNMFNEGVDFPDVECVLLLRPTESTTILTQQIGRGLRISPGKSNVLVLDFIGNYRTSFKILPALGINSMNELRKAKDKDIYYYDNDGRNVEFEDEVIKIFNVMLSKSSKEVNKDALEEEWIEYGKYIEENSAPGVLLYWKVGKKNDHLDVHFWALDYIKANPEKSANEVDSYIKSHSNEIFSDRPMEGNRALLLSKLIGLLSVSTPFKTTAVFDEIKAAIGKDNDTRKATSIVTRQLEKFYFWNNTFSLTDRHVRPEKRKPINEYFHLYPLFFVYEVILRLKYLYGYESLDLTQFEIESFLIFARRHEDLDEIVERIVAYREHEAKYEIEKYLKEKSKSLDSRFYKILRYCKYFIYQPASIKLKPEALEEVTSRVEIFHKKLSDASLLRFDENKPEIYREFLCSTKDLLNSVV